MPGCCCSSCGSVDNPALSISSEVITVVSAITFSSFSGTLKGVVTSIYSSARSAKAICGKASNSGKAFLNFDNFSLPYLSFPG